MVENGGAKDFIVNCIFLRIITFFIKCRGLEIEKKFQLFHFKNSYRRSHWRCSVRKGVLRNFEKIHRKILVPESLFSPNASQGEWSDKIFPPPFNSPSHGKKWSLEIFTRTVALAKIFIEFSFEHFLKIWVHFVYPIKKNYKLFLFEWVVVKDSNKLWKLTAADWKMTIFDNFFGKIEAIITTSSSR